MTAVRTFLFCDKQPWPAGLPVSQVRVARPTPENLLDRAIGPAQAERARFRP